MMIYSVLETPSVASRFVATCARFRIQSLLDPVPTDVDGLMRLQPGYVPASGALSRTGETDTNVRTGIATEA